MKTDLQIETEAMARLKEQHGQLVRDYKRFQGESYCPSWVVIEQSANDIMTCQLEIERLLKGDL